MNIKLNGATNILLVKKIYETTSTYVKKMYETMSNDVALISY